MNAWLDVVGGEKRWWIPFIGCCMSLFERKK
jgi:hypothetical protein